MKLTHILNGNQEEVEAYKDKIMSYIKFINEEIMKESSTPEEQIIYLKIVSKIR